MQGMTHTARLPPPSQLGLTSQDLICAELQQTAQPTEAVMSTYNGKCHLCNTVNNNQFRDSGEEKVTAHSVFSPVSKLKLELKLAHFTSHTPTHD